jgi:hypothetical protein
MIEVEVEVEVEGREGAGENSNLETKNSGERVSDDGYTKSCYMVRVLRARWRVFKYIKKNASREGDMGRGIDIFFRVWGIIVVSVDKAASSSHMNAENAINLGKKNERPLEGASNFDCLRDTTTTDRNRSSRSASLISPLPPQPRYATVPRGCTDTGCPSHHQNQYLAAP